MTALGQPIVINNSTGSDTTASGSSAGANVYGTGASTTGSSNVVTGLTTTGVQVGDLLWVQSSSGRQLSVIASVGSGQVTCDDTFANTESGRTWAIGGKRAGNDLSNDPTQTDTPNGATVEIEYTGTDYTNTGGWNPNCGSLTDPVTWKGTGSEAPRLVGPTGNVNFCRLVDGNYVFENLQFIQNKQNGGGVDCFTIFSNHTRVHFKQCTFKSEQAQAGGSLFADGRNAAHIGIFDRCIFDGNNLANRGFYRAGGSAGASPQYLVDCTFKDIRDEAIYFLRARSCYVSGCVIRDCADGIFFTTDALQQNIVVNNIFYNLSGDAVTFQNDDNLAASNYRFNIFSEITGHAFTANADYTGTQKLSMFDRNAFHNVTGSTHNNLTAGPNDISLSASPFVDPTATEPDFNINADSGGGAALRATNYTLRG